MQFEIIMTAEKLKEHLERDYKKLNLFCLLMYTVIIFIACLSIIKTHFQAVIIYYLIGLFLLEILIIILTKVSLKISMFMLNKIVNYKYGKFIELINKDGITEIIDDDAETLKWSEVKKVVKAYNFIMIKPKDKKDTSLIFKKAYFKTLTEYDNVVNSIMKYYEEYKNKEGER